MTNTSLTKYNCEINLYENIKVLDVMRLMDLCFEGYYYQLCYHQRDNDYEIILLIKNPYTNQLTFDKIAVYTIDSK